MKRSRWIALILLLGLACMPLAAQQEEEATDLIELSLGYGFGFPPASNFWLDTGSGGITQGVISDDLIHRVFIQRELAERILLDLDYDSDRQGGFFDGENIYSLQYQGLEGEFLQEISAGNRYLSIPDTRLISVDEGNTSSYALRTRMGRDTFGMQGLVRYSQALSGKRRFRGSSQLIESEALDVSYVKRRFFFLPDSQIDESSLQIYRSSDVAADRTIDGKYFALLARGRDYRFDNSTGWIYLNRVLAEEEEELLAYYRKGGLEVGNASLGTLAIIRENDGVREDFSKISYPEYFGSDTGGTDYLYLRKLSFNSYWEIKSAYYLAEVYSGVYPEQVTVQLALTATGERNDNYGTLLDSYDIVSDYGVLIFTFADGSGFYPRPFPGESPFAPPYTPPDATNPFDPENPIYGGTEDPEADVSVNTLGLRYAVDQDSYFLDFDIIQGSVRVTVDGSPLGPSYYTVDYYSGTITFSEGVIGPTSDIEVTYKYTPLVGGNQELLLALGLDYKLEWLQLRNLTTFSYPLTAPPAPSVGEERSSVLGNSTDVTVSLGSNFKDGELAAELRAGAAFALTNGNHKRRAVVADMEEDRRFAIDLSEDEWILGSLSQILPAEGVSLSNRGDLLYENYWDGDVLRSLSWDNSGNPSFAYAEKAGPYNTADRPSNGNDHSLVIDFDFTAGIDDAFVSTASDFEPRNLLDYPRFHMILRGEQISGDDVQVYVELLREYQEDLDGDDAVDKEDTASQAGFSITPLPAGSSATVIGTDRLGNGNGRIDSEDLNANGILEPSGPFVADQERGTGIVAPDAALQIVTLVPGEEDWRIVTFDIGDLIEDKRSSFEAVRAVRITVKAATSPTPSAVSGKVLINRVWLSGSGINNDSPEYLGLREVSAGEDSQVAANAFSQRYPEIYEELHGSPAYRSEYGHEEKVLHCTFDPGLSPTGQLAQDESATLSHRFGYLVDFSAYREFRLYLYLPAGQSIPTGAELTLDLVGSSLDTFAAAVNGSQFQIGWNEILVELESPYMLKINGSAAGTLSSTGAVNVLRRVSEVRFGILATPASGNISERFEFWLDEWHLAESRFSFDSAAYLETAADYSGDLLKIGSYPVLSDIGLRGGFEHREGHFLETFGKQRNTWSAGVDARLARFFPVAMDLSGYRESSGGLFKESEESLPGGYEEQDRSWSYSHLVGVDSGVDYLPRLEHTYARSVSENSEIGLSGSGYLFELGTTTGESFSFSEVYGFPKGFEQNYLYTRSWLYRDQQTILIETPPSLQSTSLDLSVTDSHVGGVSYSWARNFVSLDLSREESYQVETPELPDTLFDSYAKRMAGLFSPVPAAHPGAELASRGDEGRLFISLPRQKRLGFSLTMDSEFLERDFQSGGANRDLSVADRVSLSIPFSPGGGGALVLIPNLSRGFSGTYKDSTDTIRELWILGQSWKSLLMPPLYYLNPSLDRGRLNEYQAVDLLAGSSEVTAASEASLDTSLGLDVRLRNPPWYLPARSSLEFGGQTGREGQSYTQSRSIAFGLGSDFLLGRDVKKRVNRLSLDIGWESGWDYADKIVAHSLSLDTGLGLVEGIRGQLRGDHRVSVTTERQRIGDEKLLLFPGQPAREVEVPFQPDRDTFSSVLGLEYSWEREIDPKRQELLSASSPVAGVRAAKGPRGRVGRISHNDRLELENTFLIAERTELVNTTVVPLRLLFEHNTVMTVSEYMDLALSVKTIGGVEEIITDGTSDYQPALGFELRLTAVLNF